MSSPDGPRALFVGLGNPGAEYRSTRHNLGFRVLDRLANVWQVTERKLECNAVIGRADGNYLAWPQTYMNRSGYAVRCLVERYAFEPRDILVVYDDVALPLGRLRLRGRGGPGGHRGMESVIRNLNTDEIARLRLGILPDEEMSDEELSDFVLADFSADEAEAVETMELRAAEACQSWLRDGLDTSMNRFNG